MHQQHLLMSLPKGIFCVCIIFIQMEFKGSTQAFPQRHLCASSLNPLPENPGYAPEINENLQHRSLSNTTELYSHTQPSPRWPGLYQGPRPLVRLAAVLEKISWQKQTTLPWSTVTVKFDSRFIKLSVHVKNQTSCLGREY